MRISIEEKHSLVARYQAGESVSDICADSGVPKSTFYTWIKPYTVTMTDSGHAVSQQAFIKMKQKLQKLEKKIEILQKVNCTVSASLQEKLQELAKLHGQYSVHALGVPSQGQLRILRIGRCCEGSTCQFLYALFVVLMFPTTPMSV